MNRARLCCFLLVFVSVQLLIACGAKHRSVANRQPVPTPVANAPETTTENKPAPSASPAAPPAKRAKASPPSAPVGFTEEGNASWYGNPFHGRRASNGEIYDMYKLTAAHRTLPFETMVRVTNLNNGKSTTVRITDRGPFVANRIIDLSQAAAREIESIGPGVVPVRLEVLGNVDVTSGFFTVQVGAFRDRNNADRLRERLSVTYSPIFIQEYDSADGAFYRVRVGKISGEQAAQDVAAKLRDTEGFTTLIFRVDEK